MSNPPTPGTYSLDPSHSHVGFAVKHFGLSRVRGEFTSFEGTVTIAEDPTQSTVAVTIQSDSFDSRDEGRDAHVRSADFLDVESHPTLTFTSTSVRPDGDDWIVTGDLTVRGTSRSVDLRTTFDGEIDDPYGMGRIAFAASTRIDRTDFGLTWNQALETGGLVVGKQVDITLEVEAVRPLSNQA
ncbi:MAG: YceI family protein [Microthrixaceae bacterium]